MKSTAYKLLLSVFITFAQVIAPSLTGRAGGESLYAQDENSAFYIYQNDGHFDGFFYDEVQKISYSFLDTLGIEHDEVVSQEIVTADSTYRIMLSAIDSVGFVQPEVKYNPQLKRVDELPYSVNWYESENRIVIYVMKEYNVSEELLPHVGDVYVSFDTKYGWAAKVVKVTQNPNIDSYLIEYDLDCEPISDITDIFQQFVTVEEYGYDDEGNLARLRVAGRPDLTVGKSPKKAAGQWEGDIFNFSLSGHIPLYDKNDITININPTIEGKLHLKTVWNLSWLGDKYISILTKLNMGVGATFTVDGKISDFFPGGIGGLVGGLPIPATCPIIMLDITPDMFLRGEAHVNFSVSTPKLQGAIWSKLEIKDWVPSVDMGFGNSADGSFSLFPPFDASFVPEFEDAITYDSTMVVGDKLYDSRVISFKPTGYVIKPVDVGVATFIEKEDNTIDYDEIVGGGDFIKYYHTAQILGQDLDQSQWPKVELKYTFGKKAGLITSHGRKIRAVPFAFIAGRYLFAPKSYDIETEPIFKASSNSWVIDWDGTIRTPVTITGYIDSIDDDNPTHYNPYNYDRGYHPFKPHFLEFVGPTPADNGKNTFMATFKTSPNNNDASTDPNWKFEKYYHPLDTLKHGCVHGIHRKTDEGVLSYPFDMKTFVLPCPKDPVLNRIDIIIDAYHPMGASRVNLSVEKPNATIERLERSDAFPYGGWHVVVDYDDGSKKAAMSFDIVCGWQSNDFTIKNSQLSYSASYHDDWFDVNASVNGSFDDLVGHLGDTFSLSGRGLQGNYYEKYSNQLPITESSYFHFGIHFGYDE